MNNLTQSSSTLPTSSIQSATIQPPSTTAPVRIMRDISLSTSPTLGSITKLTFTVSVKELWEGEWEGRIAEDMVQSRAWVEFAYADIHGNYAQARKFVTVPLSSVSADSDLSWEGNALEERTITLSSSFQIPEEGIWKITGYFSTDKWEKPIIAWKQYAVADGTAVRMYTPGFSDSPLAYLSYLNYGMITDKVLNDTTDPVIMQLDISKPPLAREEANLTCTITSLYDVADFSIDTVFLKSPGVKTNIPISDFLVKGELEWQGDLKSQTPLMLSATIKFPEEGEWEINATGNSMERENTQLAGYFDSIHITITPNKAYYGWKEIIHPSNNPATITGATTPPASK